VTVLGGLLRQARSSVSLESLPLTDTNLAEWITGGARAAGVAVTETRVLGLPAYYRAIAVTAGTLSALPLHTFQTGTRDPFPLPTVLAKPNPRQTQIEWRNTCYMHGIAWGASFNRKLRDGSGRVVQVWPIHPARVRVIEVDLSDDNPEGLLFLIRDLKGQEHRYTSREILHIPYMSMDGVTGVRPLEAFRQSMGISIAADDSAASLFANGSRLSGILSTDKDLAQTQSDRLKARWRAITSGPEHAGDVAVLDNGATFVPVALPPQDVQLLESRKWSVAEVARMVGTPPHLIGDVSGSTSWGTGIEQQVLGWVKFTLQHWITLHEQRYDRELLPANAYSKNSLEGLLRGDSKARADFYRVLASIGALSPNDIRSLEDVQPVPGLDFHTIPKNFEMLDPADGGERSLSLMDMTTALQRIYLAVGKVITSDEARELLNRGGAGLGPGVDPTPPSPTDGGQS
jgi:HK97 family phage portal protein